MTAVTARVGRAAPASSKLSLLALARFEGRMMLRNPLAWVGVAVSVGWAVFELREQAPVLNRVSVMLAWTMIPLALTVGMVAGWAVLRAKGRTDADPPAVLPLGMAQRTGGVIVGLVYPALLTVGVQAGLLAWTFTRNPVTAVVWAELLAGPVFVVLAGTVAAAASRWVPHSATPLLAVLGLGGVLVSFPYRAEEWGRRVGVEWLAPLAWPQDIMPYELAFRPSGRHLAYLAALVLSIAGIAFVSHRKSSWPLLVVGPVVAVILGTAQLGEVPSEQRVAALDRLVGNEADLECEHNGVVEYCAMPGYAGWIQYWVEYVGPVVAAAPASAAEGLQVRQYPVPLAFVLDTERAFDNEWWWIEPAHLDLRERDDVLAVGSSWWGRGRTEAIRTAEVLMDCSSPCRGESQQVVKVWLAAHVPEIRRNIEEAMLGRRDGPAVVECMAADLWALDTAEDLIHQHWDVLVRPEATFEDAGAVLGVGVPTGEDEYGYLNNGCP